MAPVHVATPRVSILPQNAPLHVATLTVQREHVYLLTFLFIIITLLGSGYNEASTPNPITSQYISEKAKLSRKIREYNRKTTPVHHIHIKSSVSISVT